MTFTMTMMVVQILPFLAHQDLQNHHDSHDLQKHVIFCPPLHQSTLSEAATHPTLQLTCHFRAINLLSMQRE